MKTIIAGSRHFRYYGLVEMAIKESGFKITEVVSGGAMGIDRMGEFYAHSHKIPLKLFPADWVTHGNSAGFRRNIEMAEYADALIAIWDGKSKGTKHMIDSGRRKGLQVHILLEPERDDGKKQLGVGV